VELRLQSPYALTACTGTSAGKVKLSKGCGRDQGVNNGDSYRPTSIQIQMLVINERKKNRSMVLAASFEFLSNSQLLKGISTRSYLRGRNASNTSMVNRSVSVCLPVDSVTLIGLLSAKNTDILTIVIARTEAHSISVCQTSFHNLIQQNKETEFIQNRQHG